MKALIAEALRRWNMVGADSVFITGRENQVFKLSGPAGIFALRVRRPGLRNIAEIESELAWLDALDQAGLPVPRPHASTKSAKLEQNDGYKAHQASLADRFLCRGVSTCGVFHAWHGLQSDDVFASSVLTGNWAWHAIPTIAVGSTRAALYTTVVDPDTLGNSTVSMWCASCVRLG